ncbi:TAXI family TRAP transporter solute-binding subunit [Haematospirillum jordaniae]|uniref:Immunogenic protein n=1 Tax=Haematospirillum jordaniae TaxID=1549855 RepID=A0A143DBX3_9PROT|nr:TAXI family TRAP transporter solute-binding subunit [Haematospirillum jordaniae]AMW34214.1 hypothetical protein AY555_02375 [Haematospirillum jordaniae]NKD45053.1 TAXI family TRAP transporter solute-binding subunit [Haematospirillum jordaniae]NKD57128.1 TAXI family TRAP transporter solute-binding subunit [Haematospirillum jordaniae]NKD59361.1 TAXI family TRAP transporter solute-binding subunit [Haematospirillum jordaniae]NKD67054.1 TAXI family TRAP transporter solute-binding subunit [Haemat
MFVASAFSGWRGSAFAGVIFACAIALAYPACASESDSKTKGSADVRFVRIGTGPTGGTYFPVGGLIANALSNPPGSRPCDRGGSCGVPGLIAVAQSTSGSVENVEGLARGDLDFALVQADVAFWAQSGSGLYKGKGAVTELRAIARLYPEAVHLAVRADSGITSVAGLKGKRIGVGEEGSGTLVGSHIILEAFGISMGDIKPIYKKPGEDADDLIAGSLDAMFFVSGAPTQLIVRLLDSGSARLVPIEGPAVERLVGRYPFFSTGEIPADVYTGMGGKPIRTVTVGALMITTTRTSADFVEAITRSMWHPNHLILYSKGHPRAASMSPDTARDGLGIPLHDGARKAYTDMGKGD